MTSELIEQGRAAYMRRSWSDCWSVLRAADQASVLAPADLLMLGTSAYLVGQDGAAFEAYSRAYAGFVDQHDPRLAVRCAVYLAFLLHNQGEHARASGWIARARTLVEGHHLGGAEAGLLDSHASHLLLQSGQAQAALDLAGQAVAAARESHDPDLLTLALLTTGHARITLGQVGEAAACLDEVMLAVMGNEVAPPIAGVAYCAVIAGCMRIHDTRRAREWTAALTDWCDAQPGLVPFRGICMVHRAEIMTAAGNWDGAASEAAQACEQLSGPGVGHAFYRLGELHRLRGDVEAAERAYRSANTWGRHPEPGLMRLRLTQGRTDSAATTARALLSEGGDPTIRVDILAACVDIGIQVDDLALADTAAAELSAMAARFDQPLLHALAGRTTGQMLLAHGEPSQALPVLRTTWRALQDLDMPYDAALVRILIGTCCRALGDEDSAQMEFDAARWWLDQLGATPDVARLSTLTAAPVPAPSGLTARELQVLRLVAAGKTNRAIAGELFLADKTVARHVSNIFVKIGVSSRAAATAYAYDHALV